MQIKITRRHVKITRALRDHVEKRISLALGRFADRIGVVVVNLFTRREKARVEEKACHIEVGLMRKVRVEAAHADVFSAVDRAVDSATRSMARALEHEETLTGAPIPVRRAAGHRRGANRTTSAN